MGISFLAWAENTGFQTIDSASSCANVPFQLGNQVLTTPGVYVDSLASIYGLDSIVHVTFSHIALPLVELSPFPFDSICIEEIITPLPIGTPIGGIYLGNAIINNEINLSLAGEGIYLLEYAYEDSLSGCSDTARSQMEIVICTAIEEIGQIPGLSIYPNPSNGFITIEIQQSEIPIHTNQLKYELYSMDGQLLQVRNLNSTVDAIDLSNVGAGIYFLSILQGSNQKVFKLLVR